MLARPSPTPAKCAPFLTCKAGGQQGEGRRAQQTTRTPSVWHCKCSLQAGVIPLAIRRCKGAQLPTCYTTAPPSPTPPRHAQGQWSFTQTPLSPCCRDTCFEKCHPLSAQCRRGDRCSLIPKPWVPTMYVQGRILISMQPHSGQFFRQKTVRSGQGDMPESGVTVTVGHGRGGGR